MDVGATFTVSGIDSYFSDLECRRSDGQVRANKSVVLRAIDSNVKAFSKLSNCSITF